MSNFRPTVLEICAGGGGMALGLEQAGFRHACAVEREAHACATLRLNRPGWHVLERDVRDLSLVDFQGVDLLAGGVPCPPFSLAGKQLGALDERDLFPEALRLVELLQPRAVLLENVRGFSTRRFAQYREELLRQFHALGYDPHWRVLNAADYGVPQVRHRFFLVALRSGAAARFQWPEPLGRHLTAGEALVDLMGAAGWPGAASWAQGANKPAPTLVGGSTKHGGADLGPTRVRAQWAAMGVVATSLADAPPGPDFPTGGTPRLTVRMAARLQGFPDDWAFSGGKTAAYRQVGNALPPPLALAVGRAVYRVLAG